MPVGLPVMADSSVGDLDRDVIVHLASSSGCVSDRWSWRGGPSLSAQEHTAVRATGRSAEDQSDINGDLGLPTAARDLHFQTGYTQIYQNDSAPLSVDKAIELDLYRFDTPADASKFVQQLDRRSIGALGNPKTTSIVVAGVPGALSIDETSKEPPGVYQHNVLATKGDVAISLWWSDLTRGPSVFLRAVAAQEYAVL
jgi:hypothetical protein